MANGTGVEEKENFVSPSVCLSVWASEFDKEVDGREKQIWGEKKFVSPSVRQSVSPPVRQSVSPALCKYKIMLDPGRIA
jgi:hypothetical protein